jgi:hypothetical protein
LMWSPFTILRISGSDIILLHSSVNLSVWPANIIAYRTPITGKIFNGKNAHTSWFSFTNSLDIKPLWLGYTIANNCFICHHASIY